MIDSSKTHNSFVGVEVQSPHVIERRSKGYLYKLTKYAVNNYSTSARWI